MRKWSDLEVWMWVYAQYNWWVGGCAGGLAGCNLGYVCRDAFVRDQGFDQMMCSLSI